MEIRKDLLHEIADIIAFSSERAIRSVDTERMLMYWNIGRKIFEEEQHRKERAGYGEYLIKFLSQELQPLFGSGFSTRQLNWYRQFYRTFPIVSAVQTQLSWTHYKLLLSFDNQDKRGRLLAMA